jgi:hypothetical protein
MVRFVVPTSRYSGKEDLVLLVDNGMLCSVSVMLCRVSGTLSQTVHVVHVS